MENKVNVYKMHILLQHQHNELIIFQYINTMSLVNPLRAKF